MTRLALRNLFHDRMRLVVTLTGIVFALVLIVIQFGLYLGFTTTISGLIDHSEADLWVASRRIPYIEQGAPFSERKLYQVRATPGVAAAQKYIVRFGQWQRPDGRRESIQIVGFEPDAGFGQPWDVVAGSVSDLKIANGVLIDELYKDKLGVSRIGDVAEINRHRARVVGFTRGIRSFTTSPYVFTAFKNAQDYAGLREDQTMFIVVRAEPGVDVQALRRKLADQLVGVDVYTNDEFGRMTRFYWMFSTGAGVAVLLAASLGLIVGVVVVAQTIYASTVDHLREFGTLKAMGATNAYLYRVIVKQAVVSAAMGYGLGMIAAVFVVRASREGGAAILMPWPMAVGMFGLTLLMCVGASVVSIQKVTRLDPAMVFKG